MSKKDLFIELAKPNNQGFSRNVSIDEFVGKYAELQLGNGGSWCRTDGALGQKYNIVRHKEKGKIVHISLHGYTKQPITKPIPSNIRQNIQKQRCRILATGKVEVDHKDGRRDDPRLTDPQKVTLGDFQPLSKAANNAKREHCKKCRATDRRFDAKELGYSVSQVQGNGTYRGTCVGCYLYDPYEFNKEISKNY